jgi:hypothetical protein
MREVIFVRSGSSCWRTGGRTPAHAPGLRRDRPGLPGESANDPFFIGEFRKQVAFQSAFQLKFEIRAAYPSRMAPLRSALTTITRISSAGA